MSTRAAAWAGIGTARNRACATEASYPVAGGTVFDLEVYPNYALLGFREPDGALRRWELAPALGLTADLDALRSYLEGRLLVGFNSLGYDSPVLERLLAGADNASLQHLSRTLVSRAAPSPRPSTAPSLDLWPLVPGSIGLKACALRLGWPRLRELPFDPDRPLQAGDLEAVRPTTLSTWR